MSVDVEPQTGTEPPRSPWRWVAAVVAVAVVLVAVVASFGVFGGGSEEKAAEEPGATATVTETAPVPSASAPPAAGDATELTAAPDAARCIPPTSKWLAANAALALEGTVVSTSATDDGGSEAVLKAKNWLYADGFGGTDTVRITLPAPSTAPMPEFEKGKTYLVAANGDAQVIGCGYSDVKTGKLGKLYTDAFK